MNNLKKKEGWVFLLIGIIACLLSLTPQQIDLERKLGLKQLFESRGYLPPPKDIVIIAISNDSSKQLGYPPQVVRWSRVAHAQLINALAEKGAALIVMDIAFKESRPEQDEILSESIERAGNVVLFKYIERSRKPLSLGNEGIIDIEQQILPPAILLDKSLGAASFTLEKRKGLATNALIYEDFGNGDEPTQPLMAFLEYHRLAVNSLLQSASLRGQPEHRPMGTKEFHRKALMLREALLNDKVMLEKLKRTVAISTKDHQLRVDISKVLRVLQQEPTLNINYYGPNRTFTVIPIDKFLSANKAPEVKNKIVFVGMSETIQTEQVDTHQTVYSLSDGIEISGVEVSATVLANLLQENNLYFPGPLSRVSITIFIVFIVFATFEYFRPILALVIQAIVLIAYYQIAVWFFSHQYLWLPLVLPLTILIMTNIIALYMRHVKSREGHKHMVSALSHYLPHDVARQLSREVIDLQSQHKLVQGVCLMTDLQGYTRVSESMPPQELHSKLNRYYEKLIDIVNEHGGTVANIVGDGLLAIWTAPVLDQELCNKAFSAACAILEQNTELNSEIMLSTSIALHGGEFSLGNLGAVNHYEYSPVGDIVNTTSRIERFNRDLGTTFLCSAAVYALLSSAEMRYLGKFSFKNKQLDTALYEGVCVNFKQNMALLHERNGFFQLALNEFENNKWREAVKKFEEFLEKYPEDGPAGFYIKQCKLKLGLY